MHCPRLHRKHLTALFAVAALLWQSILPLLPAPRDVERNRVAICTEHGLRMVSVESGAGNDSQTPAPNLPGKVDCPLCVSLNCAGACLPGNAAVLLAGLSEHVPGGAPHRAVATPLTHQQLARAPPVIA